MAVTKQPDILWCLMTVPDGWIVNRIFESKEEAEYYLPRYEYKFKWKYQAVSFPRPKL